MYEKILVPLDGSELAEIALPYAEEMAVRLGSEITLLSVSETAEAPEYHKHQVYLDGVADSTKRGAKRYLEMPEGVIKVEQQIAVGQPAEEIMDYAEKQGIGLIIMATHGRSGIGRWTLGSVAEKVVRAGTTPVLLVRALGASAE